MTQTQDTPSLIVEIDEAELAVRMCEASYGLVRPTQSAAEALNAMEPDCRAGWLRAARVAAEYLTEVINNGRRPS